MGTKLSDLLADHPHTGAALASGDVLAVLDVSDTTEAATGTTKGITASELAIGVASVGSFCTDAELTTHIADTTAVHGIADTSVLATATTLATAVSNHAAATDPHADRAYADTVGNLKLAKASNLSDLADAATARTNLGLAAIAASGSASDLSSGTVPSARMPAPIGPSSGAPSTSGTLALWLAADDSSLADSGINGKGVWLWHDRSGNGRDAHQLDATLRPTVTLASQNSLSGFTTPAGGYLLGGNGPGTVSAGSVYLVIKPGTVGANNRIFSLSSYATPGSDYNGGIAALLVDGGAATNMRAFRTGLANDLDIAGGTLGTSAALFVLRWGAGSAALRKNNDAEATDTYTDYSFRADLFSILAGPIGEDAMSGAAVLYEVLWYSTKLSDGDDTTVRNYINSKWTLW